MALAQNPLGQDIRQTTKTQNKEMRTMEHMFVVNSFLQSNDDCIHQCGNSCTGTCDGNCKGDCSGNCWKKGST